VSLKALRQHLTVKFRKDMVPYKGEIKTYCCELLYPGDQEQPEEQQQEVAEGGEEQQEEGEGEGLEEEEQQEEEEEDLEIEVEEDPGYETAAAKRRSGKRKQRAEEADENGGEIAAAEQRCKRQRSEVADAAGRAAAVGCSVKDEEEEVAVADASEGELPSEEEVQAALEEYLAGEATLMKRTMGVRGWTHGSLCEAVTQTL
jgi:hypothetical protein